VERHLVDELDRIFNVTRVVELDDAQVIEIASEDEFSRQQRLELRATRRTLEAGERICRKYMARRDLKLDPPAPTRVSSTSSRPQPGRRRGQNRNEPVAPANTLQPEIRTPQYTEDLPSTFSPSKRESLERSESRATNRDTPQPSTTPTYNASGYNTNRHTEAAAFDPYAPADGYSQYGSSGAPPSFPPRNPPIPPKRPTEVDADAGSEHKSKGQGLFSNIRRKN
jgi:hypothetical protein